MSVGVLAVICWNNPWPNPRLQLGSSVALCTPQTSCLKQMVLWKITARLGQGMLCHRRAAELPCIPGNWKLVVLQFGDSCRDILHMEELQFSRRQRRTWDSNTPSLAIAPVWHKRGLKEAGLCNGAFSCSVTALKRMQSLLLFVFWVPLPARAGLDFPSTLTL